jgi:hypothetical protein
MSITTKEENKLYQALSSKQRDLCVNDVSCRFYYWSSKVGDGYIAFDTPQDKIIFTERLNKEVLRNEVRALLEKQKDTTLLAQVSKIKTGCTDPLCITANQWIDCKALTVEMLQQAKSILESKPTVKDSDEKDLVVNLLVEACRWDSQSAISTGLLCGLINTNQTNLCVFANKISSADLDQKDLAAVKQTLLDKTSVAALLLEVYPKMTASHQDALTGLLNLDLPRGMETRSWAKLVGVAMKNNSEKLTLVKAFLEKIKTEK